MVDAKEVINVSIESMKKLLGESALSKAQEVDGLTLAKGKVTKIEGDEKAKISELVTLYRGLLGNAAIVAINRAMEPLIAKDKRVARLLPPSVLAWREKESAMRKELGAVEEWVEKF